MCPPLFRLYWSRTGRHLFLYLSSLALSVSAWAQGDRSDDIQSLAEAIADDIEAERSCDVDVIGMPQFDEFSSRWLINFTVAGTECDDLPQYLSQRTESTDIQFVRRPNGDQISAILSDIVRSVSGIFRCHISLDQAPRLNESSGRWMVDYRANGRDCDAATEELHRRGREYAIAFLQRPNPTNTLEAR